MPGHHRAGKAVAHRAGPVVKFDRTTDVDTARIDFHRGALHPVGKHGAHPRQATLGLQGGVKHLFLKTCVVLADNGDLQLFTRAKVGKYARLAHACDLGQRTNTQAFHTNLCGQTEGGLHDGGFGLLPFLQGAAFAGPVGRRSAGGFGRGAGSRHGAK